MPRKKTEKQRMKEFDERRKKSAELQASLPKEINHHFWIDGLYLLLLAFTVYHSFTSTRPGLFILLLIGLNALALLVALVLLINQLFYKHFVATEVVIRVCSWSILTAIVSSLAYHYLPINGYDLLGYVCAIGCLVWLLLLIHPQPEKPDSDDDPLGIR